MTHYHVYGLGNALVDFEFAVDNDTLARLNIEKGVMTLIDEEQQIALMDQLSSINNKKASGGSAANTTIAASQFGAKTYYSCKVANDETGDFYLHDLHNCGVATNILDNQRESGHTGKCVVLVTPDADRTMNTFLGITSNLSEKELNAEAIASSDYVYLEGYLSSSESGWRAVVEARKMAEAAGKKTALTLSDPNMVKFFKANLEAMIGNGVDILFCNDDEAMMMSDTDNANDALAALGQYANTICLTQGSKGALVVEQGNIHEIAPHTISPVDTNGAGDMFAGAYLYGITHGMDAAQAGALASRASAEIVTVYGARLTQEHFQRLQQSI